MFLCKKGTTNKEPSHLSQRRAPCIAGRAEGAHPNLHVFFRRSSIICQSWVLELFHTLTNCFPISWHSLILSHPLPWPLGKGPAYMVSCSSKRFLSSSFSFLIFEHPARSTWWVCTAGAAGQREAESCTASQGRLVAGRQCTLAAYCCPHLLLLCCQVQPCAGHSRRVQSLQLQESSSKRVKTIHTIELETLFLFPWDKWCKMWALVVVIVSVVWPIPPSDMTI